MANNLYTRVFTTMLNEVKKSHEAGANIAAMCMIYVIIDSLAYLSLPQEKEYVTRKDYINWVDKYLKASKEQPYQYNGKDFYANRCSLLHTFTAESSYGEKENCKKFLFHDGSEHIYPSKESKKLVLLSISRLKDDIYMAVLNFIDDARKNKKLFSCLKSRIKKVFVHYNIPDS